MKNEWESAHQKGIVTATTETGFLPFLTFFKNCKVLDIGCGKGILLRKLAQENDLEGIGIDVVPARRSGITFVCADAQYLPFRDDTFDVVYSLGVLEHLPCTENALLESRRVLKSKGQALITVPNLFSLHTFLDRPLRQLVGLWKIGLEKSYSLSAVYVLMDQAGFRVAKHKLLFWNLNQGPALLKAYTKFDNHLNKLFNFWGFFIAIYSSKR